MNEAYLVLVAIASFLGGMALGWMLMELYFSYVIVRLKRRKKS